MLRVHVLAPALALAVTAAAAPRVKDRPKDAPTPEGRWSIAEYVEDGLARDRRSTDDYVIVFTTTTAVLEELGRAIVTEAIEYRTTATGGELDSTDPRGGLKKGIWKVDGDTLTICESMPGGARPTDFRAPSGSKRILFVLKRVPK